MSVWAWDNVVIVQCADECKTHEDCKHRYVVSRRYCCRGVYFWSKDRKCTFKSCLNDYCSNASDCNDHSLCCLSNKCVNKGCSGCTNNKDCYSGQVCCKKTFPFNQTVCASDCVDQKCNSNDDCAGLGECCRSGKCTKTGCWETCKSKSECNLDQYCCKNKKNYWGDDCFENCLGDICSTDEDCGPRNTCCISNKCVDRGCSGCTFNSDCSTGQYCCKKRHWYELNECSDHCIGKSCETNDDCGGPGETCNSDHRCTTSLPHWLTAVVTVSIVLFLTVVVIVLAVYCYTKRKRQANSTPETVLSQNTQTQETRTQNQQSNTQLSGFNYPLQNQPQHINSGVTQLPYPPSHPPGHQGGTQGTPNHGPIFQNPRMYPPPESGSQVFPTEPPPSYDYQGNQPAMTSYPTSVSSNEAHHDHNQLHDATQCAGDKNINAQQMYPLNTSHQSNEHLHNPPYNPQYQLGYPENP